jgi:hypothetical protein
MTVPRDEDPPMVDARSATLADDDIPMTFKRAREAKEREERDAREREARERPQRAATFEDRASVEGPSGGFGPLDDGRNGGRASAEADGPRGHRAVVTAFEVPFFRLAFFLVKVVLAGIPALLLLTALLWLFGQALAIYAPELLQMRILITFPR